MTTNMTQYIGGYRDSHNNIRVVQFKAEEVKREETLAELDPLAKEKWPEASSKISILRDSRLQAYRPTARQWRRDSILGRVVFVFEQIVHLFAKLWPKRPVHVDQGLMAALNADRTVANLSMMNLAPLSTVMRYAVQFLEKESKKSAVPPQLLSQFKQCAKWSASIERMQTDANPKRCALELQKLSQNISTTIHRLKKGEACIIPGGWRDGVASKGCHALYEVKRSEDGKLRFRIISRDPAIRDHVELASAGKIKIHPDTLFSSLKDSEIADPIFLEALLGLQIPNVAEKTPDILFCLLQQTSKGFWNFQFGNKHSFLQR